MNWVEPPQDKIDRTFLFGLNLIHFFLCKQPHLATDFETWRVAADQLMLEQAPRISSRGSVAATLCLLWLGRVNDRRFVVKGMKLLNGRVSSGLREEVQNEVVDKRQSPCGKLCC